MNHRKVASIILQHQDLFLIGLRHYPQKHLNSWQFPQGGIEDDESPLDAAKRELFEEAGIDPEILTWSHPEMPWIDVSIPQPNKYDAQRVKFFHAIASELPEVRMCSKEFLDHQWIHMDEFLEMSVNLFKHPAYVEAARYYHLVHK